MQEKINKLAEAAIKRINNSKDLSDLEQIRIDFLGRKDGSITKILRNVSELPQEQRKVIGTLANDIKKELESKLKNCEKLYKQEKNNSQSFFDETLPAGEIANGTIHPLTRIRLEVEEIFSSMGFKIYEGNELTNLNYNFLSLNFPENHPAMDSYDTFFIKENEKKKIKLADRRVMRAHTSNMQVKIMEENKPPLRVIVPGRCFRHEATDASHEHTFHQIEGFVVDKNISIANLIYIQKILLSKIFKQNVKVRLRPGYFPFVEPGFELDASCVICNGRGCSVCKKTGWIELIPCGMIHPKVFESAGYPKGKYTGFAFGMGWSRLAMMKYGIDDIRLFMENDLRFLKQF